ncbi:centrosome-associated protein CEP250-like isoform X3 [Gouania willdenowi]|uniref:centrosome-associated protein CEP250-like isoform X3 n=2 Tax=Gouania willdenowi TaxID=441366 RepID=UPI0010555A60|nr:centrosome-associated protein CEP250-like isoform X3 [Gouania willdenowi]
MDKLKANRKSKKEMEEQLDKTRKREMEEELTTLRLTLEEKDREIKSLQQSKGTLEEQLKLTRSSLEHKDEELQCANKSKGELEEQLNFKRSALNQREYELQCANKSKGEFEEQLRSALRQREYELQCAIKSKGEFEEQLNFTRSVLQQREHELRCANKRIQDMDENYMQQFQAMSNHMDKETEKSSTLTLTQTIIQKVFSVFLSMTTSWIWTQCHRDRIKQVENHWQNQLRAVQEQRCKEKDDHHIRLMEMEKHFNEKLQEKRCALNQKQEELQSFKDRVANDVALSIQTGNTESMNNPVGKFRLKEMYDDLIRQWPKIKNSLKSGKDTPPSVKAMIQKTFEETSDAMEQKKKQIDEVFGLNDGVEPTPQRLEEYKLSTIHYLQLNLYYHRKAGSMPCFEDPQDVMDYVRSQCSWLGSLMALNNPPLQPDWDNHDPGMNAWDIFPRKLRSSSFTVL